MGLSQIIHLWWIIIALSFFLKDEVFFSILFLLSLTSSKIGPTNPFATLPPPFFFNFIELIFEIGHYLFKKKGIGFDLIFIYGTIARFLTWFPVFNNFYKENYLGPRFIGRYNTMYGRLFNGHGPIP